MRPSPFRLNARPMRPEAEHPQAEQDEAAEVERLREQRDEAVEQLDRYKRRESRGSITRRVITSALVVLFIILLPVTVVAGWTHRTIFDTETYVNTVTPIGADPAVTEAVSRDLTNQLYAALDPEAIIAGALPPKATFLAGPIAGAAKNEVQDAVNRVLRSDRFQQLWASANRFAHEQLVAALRGDENVLQSTGGQVVINLVPLLNAALANAGGLVSGVVGRQVDLPTVTAADIPSAACGQISAALGRPLPPTCGQFVLFPDRYLKSVQRAVQAYDRLLLALLIVVPLIFAAALWLSRRRRRTLLQMTIGAMVALIFVRRGLIWEQNHLVNTGRPENKDARSAIVHGLLSGFFDLTWWLLIGGLVIVVVAAITGPYRWAVATRRALAQGGHKAHALYTAAVTGTVSAAQDQATVNWVRAHFDQLRIGGVVVAVLLLLVLSVNFIGFLVIVALLALYEVWLHRLRPPSSISV
jgi:hypothetical protein